MAQHGRPQPAQLAPIQIGLGAQDGYSDDDLTSARIAAVAGEVPYRPLQQGAPDQQSDEQFDVLELRIHGVGGAPPTVNLEVPTVVQVAGDSGAGFYRAWYPGGAHAGGAAPVDTADEPRREAYCWGELDYRSATSALWVLLLPFGLLNVAHWALPATRREPLQAVSRAWLRLISLLLTAGFTATASYLLVDVFAWQSARRQHLWTWLHLYTDRGFGARIALAMLLVFAIIGGLWALSRHTAGMYERKSSGFGAPPEDDWRLSRATFWCGERTVVRQRYAHLTVAAAVVLFVITRPDSSFPGVRTLCAVVAVALAAAAAAIVALPWSDRITSAGSNEPNSPGNRAAQALTFGALGVALAATVSRFWWRPHPSDVSIPWDSHLQVWLPIAELGAVLVLFVLIAAQHPAGSTHDGKLDVLGRGYAAGALALLACLVSAIFGSALTLGVANVLAKPTSMTRSALKVRKHDLLIVPTSVYAGALALLIALGSLAVVAVVLFGTWRRRRAQDRETWVPATYQRSGRIAADPVPAGERHGEPAYARTTDCIARTWAKSELTDYIAGILFGVAVPTGLGYLAY